jgi:hypothetical protein
MPPDPSFLEILHSSELYVRSTALLKSIHCELCKAIDDYKSSRVKIHQR